MKKTLLVLGIAIIAGTSYICAQEKSSVFIKGGLNLANITADKDGNIDDAKGIASFHVGLQGDLPITRFFAIQPGIFFTGKGAKVEVGNTSGSNWLRSTTRPFYIEVPVNAVVKIPLGEESSFFVGAGPYAAVGIAGKNKIEGEIIGIDGSRTRNIKFSNDDPFSDGDNGAEYGLMRRFDYGVNGTVGIQSKRALFSVNYGVGLAKIQSGTSSSDDELGKHRVLSFSVGFRL